MCAIVTALFLIVISLKKFTQPFCYVKAILIDMRQMNQSLSLALIPGLSSMLIGRYWN